MPSGWILRQNGVTRRLICGDLRALVQPHRAGALVPNDGEQPFSPRPSFEPSPRMLPWLTTSFLGPSHSVRARCAGHTPSGATPAGSPTSLGSSGAQYQANHNPCLEGTGQFPSFGVHTARPRGPDAL